jgi:hypothetical protein
LTPGRTSSTRTMRARRHCIARSAPGVPRLSAVSSSAALGWTRLTAGSARPLSTSLRSRRARAEPGERAPRSRRSWNFCWNTEPTLARATRRETSRALQPDVVERSSWPCRFARYLNSAAEAQLAFHAAHCVAIAAHLFAAAEQPGVRRSQDDVVSRCALVGYGPRTRRAAPQNGTSSLDVAVGVFFSAHGDTSLGTRRVIARLSGFLRGRCFAETERMISVARPVTASGARASATVAIVRIAANPAKSEPASPPPPASAIPGFRSSQGSLRRAPPASRRSSR